VAKPQKPCCRVLFSAFRGTFAGLSSKDVPNVIDTRSKRNKIDAQVVDFASSELLVVRFILT
jgi:hypothetical protein